MSKASAITEWLGIRGLDAALPLALLSGAIILCWTLPAAIIPVEALRHLGDAQKVSVLFFAWGLAVSRDNQDGSGATIRMGKGSGCRRDVGRA